MIVGDFGGILIPQLTAVRTSGGRLKGLRLVHTHLAMEDISDEDLMDLLFLRLDMLSVIKVLPDGLPEKMYTVHLIPDSGDGANWQFLEPVHPANQTESAKIIIDAIEDEFARNAQSQDVDVKEDRAILISVSTESRIRAEESLKELVELARSDNITVLETVLQRRKTLTLASFSVKVNSQR